MERTQLFKQCRKWLYVGTGLWVFCLLCPGAFSQSSLATGSSITTNSSSFDGTVVESGKSSNLIFETLDYPGALATRALGINAQGTVVGSFDDNDGTHGFVFGDGKFKGTRLL